MLQRFIFIFATLFSINCVAADTNRTGYLTVALHQGVVTSDDTDDGWTPRSASITGGLLMSDYLGLEGRLLWGMNGSSTHINECIDKLGCYDENITFELERAFSVFLRPRFATGRIFVMYALVGYTYAVAEVETQYASNKGSEDGASFGLGMTLGNKYRGPKLGLEVVQYFNGDYYTYSGVNAGVQMDF